MSHTLLLHVSAPLQERMTRVADAYGWGQQEATIHLINHGLSACEAEMAARLDASDAAVLHGAIAALEQLPDDPGFALIGRAPSAVDTS